MNLNFLKKRVKNPFFRVAFFVLALGGMSLAISIIVFAFALSVFKTKQVSPIVILFTLYPTWLILVYLFRCKLEGKNIKSLGLSFSKGWSKWLSLGLLTGAVIISFVFTSNLALGSIKIESLRYITLPFLLSTILKILPSLIALVFIEELIFRGYLLHTLFEDTSLFLAILISSLLFGASHIINAGFNSLGTLNIFLFGVFASLMTLLSNSLWFAIGFHLTWNLFQGTVFGFPMYGRVPPETLLNISFFDSKLITGGSFGLEASILTTLILLICCSSFLVEGSPESK
jgi:hypothetical protein